ncbi:MAG: hypothetical protein IJQ11_00320 [Bacteroidales bacterium]|nr:hypothetical protein [Bacteroidales bacterium]
MSKVLGKAYSVSVIMVALLFVACQSNPIGYVRNLERFVERVERDGATYSQEQWERYDEQLGKYVESYKTEKSKLTPEERRKVGELTIRYYKARAKYMGLGILGELGEWLDYLKGFADEIKKDVEKYQNQ